MTRLHYLIFWGLISGAALFVSVNVVFWLRRIALALEVTLDERIDYNMDELETDEYDCPCCRANG